jgi:GTP cyclohydrolase I
MQNEVSEEDALKAVETILKYIGEDPNREGLKETPKRVLKSWKEMTKGYEIEPTQYLKAFTDGSEGYDQMVILDNIPFTSNCEHHMLPIFGYAHVGYIPRDRILGLSKFSRIVDNYAKRLQVQERLTVQIADTIEELLNPLGVGVVLQARHMCMEARGICKSNIWTSTSALRGVMKDNSNEARLEFLDLIHKKSAS